MPSHALPPDVFEAVVNALAEALVRDHRARHASGATQHESTTQPVASASSPWLTAKDAATRARCSIGTLFREVRADRLRAVRVGGRRTLRFRAEWVDTWLNGREVRP
jgi:excisionase family DNA binding protein